MDLKLLWLLGVIFFHSFTDGSNMTEEDAMNYMRKYGYVSPSDEQSGLMNPETMKVAVQNFQRFAGLNMSGELNEETLNMMEAPRCGDADMLGTDTSMRKKRYALTGSRWPRRRLTYRIREDSYTRDLSQNAVNQQIREAFDWWSEVTDLTFTRVFGQTRPDIDIRFVQGNHGDGNPFDGPGRTLAHAFFPTNGDAHFDDAETWILTTDRRGVNLKLVAAHEFGHSLGLGHSDITSALMAPFYNAAVRGLHPDDIRGIQALYGTPVTRSPATTSTNRPVITTRRRTTTTRPPTTTRIPPVGGCNGRFDAVTQMRNRSTYIFVGDMFWRLSIASVDSGFPQRIIDVWGIDGPIDAALSFTQFTDLFRGSQVFRFINGGIAQGFPRNLSLVYIGIPGNIDAAFQWSGNGKIYFMKGGQYWRYNTFLRRVDPNYPRDISAWRGIPPRIDAATQWFRQTYFFADGLYYRFNDTEIRVAEVQERPYPRRSDQEWLMCTDRTLNLARSKTDNGANEATPNKSVLFILSILTFVLSKFFSI